MEGFGHNKTFTSSSRMRSGAASFSREAICFMVFPVSGSMLKPSSTASRTARKRRSGSSINLSLGLRVALIILLSISILPLNGSINLFLFMSKAMALIVKSRCLKSSFREPIPFIFCLKLVTSYSCPELTSVTVSCLRLNFLTSLKI